jgi:hypothetical protein
MMMPIQRLQKMARTIPTITRIPPTLIPPFAFLLRRFRRFSPETGRP